MLNTPHRTRGPERPRASALIAAVIAGVLTLLPASASAHEEVVPLLEKRGSGAEVWAWLKSVLASPAQAATSTDFKGPTKPKDISVKDLGKFGLGKELAGMEGRDIRVRLWTMKPGGIVPVHSHKDRPAQIYVLSGEVVEHRSDTDTPHVYKKGDLSLEAEGVVHWWENTGGETVLLLAVDVFNTQR